MKNALMLLLALFLFVGAAESVAQEKNKTQKAAVVDTKPVNTVCPVSGEPVDTEITHAYNGKTYALCCKSCLKKFQKDPEKYIKKMKTEESKAPAKAKEGCSDKCATECESEK